jgi:hypothetical protein
MVSAFADPTVTYNAYPPDGGGGISASGDTGDVPVCCAKWWDGRREIASPVMIALPTAITPTDTTPAISNSIYSGILLSLSRWRGAAPLASPCALSVSEIRATPDFCFPAILQDHLQAKFSC